MADLKREAGNGIPFYTYTYTYETAEEVRSDLMALRTSLLQEKEREEPSRDMKIVRRGDRNRMRTAPCGGFIRDRYRSSGSVPEPMD